MSSERTGGGGEGGGTQHDDAHCALCESEEIFQQKPTEKQQSIVTTPRQAKINHLSHSLSGAGMLVSRNIMVSVTALVTWLAPISTERTMTTVRMTVTAVVISTHIASPSSSRKR